MSIEQPEFHCIPCVRLVKSENELDLFLASIGINADEAFRFPEKGLCQISILDGSETRKDQTYVVFCNPVDTTPLATMAKLGYAATAIVLDWRKSREIAESCVPCVVQGVIYELLCEFNCKGRTE